VKTLARRTTIVIGIATAITISALAMLAYGSEPRHHGHGFSNAASCTLPNLPGIVVKVALVDMGGPMMGRSNSMMGRSNSRMPGGVMRLAIDHSTVTSGTVSLVATNVGSRTHELVVLPLSGSQEPGTRIVGKDGRVDETDSLGEASKACGNGAGEGIVPRSSGWVTLNLAPGRYELICNLTGHYAAGMYQELIVT